LGTIELETQGQEESGESKEGKGQVLGRVLNIRTHQKEVGILIIFILAL